jgi:hypothetical protein
MVAMRRRRASPSDRRSRSSVDGAALDLTVLAVPFYFASMGAEYLWLRRRAAQRGPTAGDYERRDTLASLAMGVGSLVAPWWHRSCWPRSPRAGGATPRLS